jgi:hypothetical protein
VPAQLGSPARAIQSALGVHHDRVISNRAVASVREGKVMDVRAEARRLASVSSVFVWVGWFMVAYAITAGILWWIDLTSRQTLNFLEALGLSLDVVAGPLFLALIVAGLGHFARLFALYVAERPIA